MHEINTNNQQMSRYKFKEPALHNVILHNDDVTTMDFVVYILVSVFHKSTDDAEKLMLKVHNEGSAIAGTYLRDIALSKKNKVDMLSKANGFPLLLTVEEA